MADRFNQNVQCNPLSPASFHKMCRICLLVDSDLQSVFDEYKDGLNILQVYESTTLLKIEEDELPKNICKPCLEILYVTYWFIDTCKSVNQRLRAVLNESKVAQVQTLEDYLQTTKSACTLKDFNSTENSHTIENPYSLDSPCSVGSQCEIEFPYGLENSCLLNPCILSPCTVSSCDISPCPLSPCTASPCTVSPGTLSQSTVCACRTISSCTVSPSILSPSTVSSCATNPCISDTYTDSCSISPFGISPCSSPVTTNSGALIPNVSINTPVVTSIDDVSSLSEDYKRIDGKIKANLDASPVQESLKLANLKQASREQASVKKSTLKKSNTGKMQQKIKPTVKRKFFYNIMKWTCKLCKKSFRSAYSLKTHMKSHSKEKLYECDECGRKFCFPNNLARHKKLHNGKLHICLVCGKAYTQAALLRDHGRLHTGETPYQCQYCQRKFRTAMTYKNHLRKHQIDNREVIKDENLLMEIYKYQCHVCNKLMSSKGSLSKHLLIHAEKKFVCDGCGKAFANKGNLQSHTKTHSLDRPYKCSYCDKSFRHKGSLQQHTFIHEGIKPYKCKECPKSFVQHHQLSYHMRTHSGERPYSCSFCGKSFTLNGNLIVHLRTHESKKFQEDCSK